MRKLHELYERAARRFHNIFKFHPSIKRVRYRLITRTSQNKDVMVLTHRVPENARLQDVAGIFGYNWPGFKKLPKGFGPKNQVRVSNPGYNFYLIKEKA